MSDSLSQMSVKERPLGLGHDQMKTVHDVAGVSQPSAMDKYMEFKTQQEMSNIDQNPAAGE